MTDPLPERPLPRALADRIRRASRRARRRRTAIAPPTCIFGSGAFLDEDSRPDGDRPPS